MDKSHRRFAWHGYAVLPCSSIPLFMGFTSAGLPLGVTFSFLISSPMVDLGSLVLLASIFGWKIAVAYVILGLLIALVGGMFIKKLNMQKYVAKFIQDTKFAEINSPILMPKERASYAKSQTIQTLKKVFLYI